jgi:hypothetical protein
MNYFILILFFAFSHKVHASGCGEIIRKIDRDAATTLSKALKLIGASVYPSSKEHLVLGLKNVSCHVVNGEVLDGLPRYECTDGTNATKTELYAMIHSL